MAQGASTNEWGRSGKWGRLEDNEGVYNKDRGGETENER
jgi:hypothetical protein